MTFVGIEADPSGGRARLTLAATQLSPRTLDVGPGRARIAMVGTTALLLGGDAVEVRIVVGAGCHLEIVDTAGTVAYDGRGAAASWRLTIDVADHATLLWNAEPFVVAHGADIARTTDITLAGTGAVCLRETLVLGRAGEVGGALTSRTTVTHSRRPLLAEELDLVDPGRRGAPGLLGGHTVIDTLGLYGTRVDAPNRAGSRIFQLAGPGTVARHLGTALHRSGVPDRYADFRAALANHVR